MKSEPVPELKPQKKLSRPIVDWAAGVTSAVALYQGVGPSIEGVPNRIVLAISFGLTVFFVLRSFSRTGTFSATHPKVTLPLAEALDSMSEGVLVVDRDGKILLANRSLSNTLQVSLPELQGKSAHSLAWKIDRQSETENDFSFPWEEALEKSAAKTGTILGLQGSTGKQQRYIVNATTIKTARRSKAIALVTLSDVTDLETRKGELVGMLRDLRSSRDEISQRNDELQELATKDPLTGCLNRRGFLDQFESLWTVSERHDRDLGFLMVDIDHFKQVNDTYGHAKGDEVLAGVAELLRDTFRESDVICRYGGEEFCVVLPGQGSEASIVAGERFLDALRSQPRVWAQHHRKSGRLNS